VQNLFFENLRSLGGRALKFFQRAPVAREPLRASEVAGGQEVSFTDSYLYGRPAYPYNPDSLVGKKGLAVYRQIALDEQVKAALSAKKFAALSTGFEIRPAVNSKSSDAGAQEAAEFVEFNLEEIEGTLESKLHSIMSALDFGYSVSEQTFWLIDYGRWAGKIGLKDIKTRKPDGIELETDEFGNLLPDGVIQAGRRLPANRFLIYSFQKQFSNFYGQSDLRAVYRAAWAKEQIIKFMCMSLERYGMPIPVFKPTGTMTEEQRASAQAFINDLQAKSGLILPAGIEFGFEHGQPRAAEAFIPAINLLDQQIRVGLLMPGLIGLSAEQQTGSFARSMTEFDVFLWILKFIRNDLETLVNEYLIKPLIDLNYEVMDGKYPQFKFKEITEEHKQRLLNMWLMALAGNAVTPTREDENITRQLMDRPELPDKLQTVRRRAA
jgi:phage gp29-like protein